MARLMRAARGVLATLALVAATTLPALSLAHGWQHAHEAEHAGAGAEPAKTMLDRVSVVSEPDGDTSDHDTLHVASSAPPSVRGDLGTEHVAIPSAPQLFVAAPQPPASRPLGEPRGSPDGGQARSATPRAPPAA